MKILPFGNCILKTPASVRFCVCGENIEITLPKIHYPRFCKKDLFKDGVEFVEIPAILTARVMYAMQTSVNVIVTSYVGH